MYSYRCILTGKEVFSDTHPHTLEDDGFVWIIEGNYKEIEHYSEGNYDGSYIVNNLLRDFHLEEPAPKCS